MTEFLNKVDYPEYSFKSNESSYAMEISIVNTNIVFISISGVAVYEEYLKAQVFLNKFMSEKIDADNTYYLFHNYANLVEIPSDTRVAYKNWVLDNIHIFDFVFFFNLNLISQLIIKLGKKTTPLFDKIFIVNNFEDALAFIKQKKRFVSINKVDKLITKILDNTTIIEKEEWSGSIDNGRLKHFTYVVDGDIIIRKLEGVFEKGDMQYLTDSLDVIKNDIGLGSKKYFLFLDVQKLVGVKIQSRTEAVEWFIKESELFNISGFFGADKLTDLVIKFSINVSSLKDIVFNYSNLNDVLTDAFTFKGEISAVDAKKESSFFSRLFSKAARIKELEAENARLIEFNSDRINKLYKIIGDITWDENLKPPSIDIADSDPYSDVFYSLKLLYFDVKEIIGKREEMVDKAKESDRLKFAFLANMSHEIRTRLNRIIGFTDLLLEEDQINDKHKRFLDIIKKNSDNLLDLINDIIQISSIEAQQLKIANKQFSVNSLMTGLDSLFDSIVIKDGLKINIKFVSVASSDILLFSDELRISQVLTNLIGNAIKFTSEGHVFFGYNIVKEDDKEVVKFYIQDTGIGVRHDKQEIIFDRFRQIDESNTRQYGGTGLGLSISKNLVKLLGGRIWVKSKENEGSTFYFTIPYKKN